MKRLVVVERPKRWPLQIPGVEMVAARDYLVDPKYAETKRATVFNMCRRYGYQTVGYYVSLLAAARGHRPLPSVETLQALGQSSLVRLASEDLDVLMARSLSSLKSTEFELSVYFGRNVARRYDRLASQLFNHFPAPFLRARFLRENDEWRMVGVRPLPASEIPDSHHDFVVARTQEYLRRPRARHRPKDHRYDLAVLWVETDEHKPSNASAIRCFKRAAARHSIAVETIGGDDIGRIAEFDALFIRQTTRVDHHTYRFASRAVAEGLVVIDHPNAIVRSTNKVYQAELFERLGVDCPRTLVVHEGNRDAVAGEVGLPCVLKKPDGAFSTGVVLARSEADLEKKLDELFEESELVVAQEFTPSDYDWRVGVLDRQPLFVAKYHMAKGHWQIVKKEAGETFFGNVETLAVEDAPAEVVSLALRAASPLGDGLFGVDLKQVDGRVLVMEVNDNPNLDHGYEDRILGDALWDEVARWFRVRLDRRGLAGETT